MRVSDFAGLGVRVFRCIIFWVSYNKVFFFTAIAVVKGIAGKETVKARVSGEVGTARCWLGSEAGNTRG